jgi:hypothetical protein
MKTLLSLVLLQVLLSACATDKTHPPVIIQNADGVVGRYENVARVDYENRKVVLRDGSTRGVPPDHAIVIDGAITAGDR